MKQNEQFLNVPLMNKVLSLLIQEPKHMALAVKMHMTPDWFTGGPQKLYEAMLRIHESGHEPDLATLGQQFAGPLNSGLFNLAQDIYGVHTESTSRFTALEAFNALHNNYGYRELQSICLDTANELDPTVPIEETLDAFRTRISMFNPLSITGRSREEMLAELEDKANHAETDGSWGIPSRWSRINEKIAGYERGKMSLVCARPGEGKSSYCLCENKNVAKHHGPTAIFSFEMTEEEILAKMAADEANIDFLLYKKGLLRPEEREKFRNAWRYVSSLPIHIFHKGMSAEVMIATATELINKHGIVFATVDYINRISARRRFKDRIEEVGYLSKLICDHGVETKLHWQVACQLNRLATREKPNLSHLRECGKLEEDAYLVALVSTDPQYTASREDNVPCIVDIAKCRGGKMGEVKMIFAKSQQRFEQVLEK